MKFETLPNGIRLVTAQNKHLNSVVVMAGVGVGSRHEPDGLHGASHFVEHVFFKGTKRRTAKGLASEIEGRGGEWNALTDKELTAFHIEMSRHDGAIAVDCLHDMLANASFRDTDVVHEHPVIHEEISMYDNDPGTTAWEGSERHAYAGTGLAHRITGEVADVRYTAQEIRDFYLENYVPSRMVVVLAGAVSKKVRELARRKFGSMPARHFAGNRDPKKAGPFKPGHLFTVGQTDRLHLIMRFPGVPAIDRGSRPLDLLALLFGGYTSARLFQSLREDKSLCYSVAANMTGYSDAGSIIVSTSLERDKLGKAMKAIRDEVKSVRANITKDELQRAKMNRRGGATLHFEDPMNVASDVIRQIFTDGRHEDYERKIEKILAVKRSEVVEAARTYLDLDKMHVSISGPKAARKEVEAVFA